MAYASNDGRGVVVIFPTQQQFFALPPATTASSSALLPVLPGHPPVAVMSPSVGPSVSPVFGFGCFNPAALYQIEAQRSMSLLKYIADEGLIPTPDEELKRSHAIDQLKQIVLQWVKMVASQRQLPRNFVRGASATVLTYGSYGLGVHNLESDIDALCIGPCFATMAEDFFVVLRDMLANRPEVSEIHCIKEAKVPLMQFKFDGISIDLPYAQLKVIYVPEDLDILDPSVLRCVKETSWKSLSGVRVNKSILQLVPNLTIYQSMLRCVKLWAKRRGVYGNICGFFGGVHLAILVAFICQRHPCANLSALLSIFFETFALWPWPRPVNLLDGILPASSPTGTKSFIPIRLPCSPYEYCQSYITRSTFSRITAEFRRGYNLTRDLLRPDFNWVRLFEAFPFSAKYARFVKICISASDQDKVGSWLSWVKSRFPSLINRLEATQGFCNPNPTESVDSSMTEPNVVFFWGLHPGRMDFVDISPVEEEFKKNVMTNQGCQGEVSLSIVNSSQLPKSVEHNSGNMERMRQVWRVVNHNQQEIPMCSRVGPPLFHGHVVIKGGGGGS